MTSAEVSDCSQNERACNSNIKKTNVSLVYAKSKFVKAMKTVRRIKVIFFVLKDFAKIQGKWMIVLVFIIVQIMCCLNNIIKVSAHLILIFLLSLILMIARNTIDKRCQDNICTFSSFIKVKNLLITFMSLLIYLKYNFLL